MEASVSEKGFISGLQAAAKQSLALVNAAEHGPQRYPMKANQSLRRAPVDEVLHQDLALDPRGMEAGRMADGQ